jgi:hypothetical protein
MGDTFLERPSPALDTYQPITPSASQNEELQESSAAMPPILAFGLATNNSEA